MKSVTIEQIISWGPCGLREPDDGVNYTPQRIKRLVAEYGSNGKITAAQAAAIPYSVVPSEDVMWFLLHREFVTKGRMRSLAREFAKESGEVEIPAWFANESAVRDVTLDAAYIAAAARGRDRTATWYAAWDEIIEKVLRASGDE